MAKGEGGAKESRADWVAVEAQFQQSGPAQPAKAKTAYQIFMKRVMDDVKRELGERAEQSGEALELGVIAKEVSSRWQQLSVVDRQEFVELAAADKKRYEDECRARDEEVEAERKRKRDDMYAPAEGKRERKKVRVLCIGDMLRVS